MSNGGRSLVIWLGGMAALVLAMPLFVRRPEILLLAAVAWCAAFAARGVLAVLLATLYLPATIDIGLPVDTVSVFYFIAVGAALLYGARFGFRVRHTPVMWVLPLAFMPALIGWPMGAGIGDIDVASRPLLALVALTWLLARAAADARATFHRCLVVAMWVGVLVAALAVYQTVTDTWPVLDDLAVATRYTSATFFGRPGGTMGHPILLGAVLTAMAVVAVVLKPRGWRLAAAALLVGIVLSGSRSAYLAVLAALLVMVAARRDRRSLSVNQIAGLALGAVVAVYVAAQNSYTLATQLGDLADRLQLRGDVSLSNRGARASIAWHQITDGWSNFLFGQGPLADTRYILGKGIGDKTALTFDNFYLVTWFNFGLVGVLALVFLLLAAWRKAGPLARPLVAVQVVELMFFDALGWPAMICLLALTCAATVFDRGADLASDVALDAEAADEPRRVPGQRA